MKTCQNCNEDFEVKDKRSKFCSRSCAASYNNRVSPKRERTRRNINCLHCSSELLSKNNSTKFCNNECHRTYAQKLEIDAWLSGGSGSTSTGELKRLFRRYLLDEAENKCTECGWSIANPVTGTVTLTIDHINGDATDNKRKNLKVLCYNCHTLTPTFNALNRGNGTRYETPGSRARRLAKENKYV